MSSAERSSSSGPATGELAALPIFPLGGVYLFPHAVLPLHVFEPRYRELLGDCLKGDRRMAIATLEPGHEAEYLDRPPVRAICGVGEVIAHEALPEGRSNLLLRGITRARILEELPPAHSYRQVRARALPDEDLGLDDEDALRTFTLLADQLAARLPSGGDTLRELVRSQSAPGPLSDILSAALVTDPAARQALLETTDVAVRVERVAEELARLLGRFVPKGRGPAN